MENKKLSGNWKGNSMISVAELEGAIDITTTLLQRQSRVADANQLKDSVKAEIHEMSEHHKKR